MKFKKDMPGTIMEKATFLSLIQPVMAAPAREAAAIRIQRFDRVEAHQSSVHTFDLRKGDHVRITIEGDGDTGGLGAVLRNRATGRAAASHKWREWR